MEQISDIWYSEDCRVSAVELEGWKIVLNRFRISVSNFGFEFRFRISGWEKTIFGLLASDNFPVSILLATTPFSRVFSPIWSSSFCTEYTKITYRRRWIVVRHCWSKMIEEEIDDHWAEILNRYFGCN